MYFSFLWSWFFVAWIRNHDVINLLWRHQIIICFSSLWPLFDQIIIYSIAFCDTSFSLLWYKIVLFIVASLNSNDVMKSWRGYEECQMTGIGVLNPCNVTQWSKNTTENPSLNSSSRKSWQRMILKFGGNVF